MRGSTLLTESELDRTLRIDEQKGEPGQTSPVYGKDGQRSIGKVESNQDRWSGFGPRASTFRL
jgi:hypothetical protein